MLEWSVTASPWKSWTNFCQFEMVCWKILESNLKVWWRWQNTSSTQFRVKIMFQYSKCSVFLCAEQYFSSSRIVPRGIVIIQIDIHEESKLKLSPPILQTMNRLPIPPLFILNVEEFGTLMCSRWKPSKLLRNNRFVCCVYTLQDDSLGQAGLTVTFCSSIFNTWHDV